jgi:hypothetical protein
MLSRPLKFPLLELSRKYNMSSVFIFDLIHNCFHDQYSRPSRTNDWDYDFFVDFKADGSEKVSAVVESLRSHTKNVTIIGSDASTDSKCKVCAC